MAKASPKEESVEMFNRLIEFPVPSPADEVVQILLRAKNLARKQPSDFQLQLVIAHAHLTLGNRGEAKEALAAASALRRFDEQPGMIALAQFLSMVGNHTETEKVDDQLLTIKGIHQDPVAVPNAARHALFAGSVDRLSKLVDEFGEHHSAAGDILAVVRRGELESHLSSHMTIVNDIVGDDLVWVDDTYMAGEDELDPMILMEYFVVGDRSRRYEIEKRLSDGLGRYYEGQGLSQGHYLPHLLPTVVTVTKRPLFAAA